MGIRTCCVFVCLKCAILSDTCAVHLKGLMMKLHTLSHMFVDDPTSSDALIKSRFALLVGFADVGTPMPQAFSLPSTVHSLRNVEGAAKF